MSRILVTGGTGYIGSHTTVELMQQGFDVTIVDNLSNSSIDVLDGITAIVGRKPDFANIDCGNFVDLDNVFKDRTVEEHRELTSLAEKKDLEGYRRFLTAHIGHIFADADEMKERFPAMFISNGEEKSD